MPRELKNKTAAVTFVDSIAGGQCKFYYRIPTASEIQEYDSMRIRREKNQSFDNTSTARITMAARILTGIREGDFTVGDRPLSSDEKSENYDANWKDKVLDAAPDLLLLLGAFVFDHVPVNVETPAEAKEAGEEVVPFSRS
jgi:hypothetical protein